MKAILLGGLGLALLGGCSQSMNPFRDEFANTPPVTTPSVEAVLAVEAPPYVQEHHGVEKYRSAADGTVIHQPVYFEDPSVDCWGDDGHFAWTGWDYAWMALWRIRFLGDLVALPASVVINPPWQTTVSDGQLSCCGRGRRFDSVPCRKPKDSESDSKQTEQD